MTYETIEEINKRIENMTEYGTITEKVKARSYMLYWSNASKKWYVSGYAYLKGDTVTLDANELLVKERRSVINEWIDKNMLVMLPLYKNSFEAMKDRAIKQRERQNKENNAIQAFLDQYTWE